jgi:hypothetical protein
MPNKPSFNTSERIPVAVEAAIQMDGIFEALIAAGRELEASDMPQESAVIRALAIRGKQFALASLSVLDDELASVERYAAIVENGAHVNVEAEAAHGS